MCGIAAIAGITDPDKNSRAISQLLASMAHRGPDSHGQWPETGASPGLSLVHTRLAILDLSPAGAQPMTDPASGNVIAFNGEIYNFADLRRDITGADPGTVFSSCSDTEVLLKGYGLWGVDVFARLDGMFAVLIYDHVRRQLVMARDHAGIKPLYFSVLPGGGLILASEVRAITASGLLRPEVDPLSLAAYLDTGSVQEPRTILAGINAFPAAHYAIVDLSGDRPRLGEPVRYWDALNACRGMPGLTAAEHREMLAHTVAEQLVADVPVGIFLSAGIDSTALAEAVPLKDRERLRAFTVARGDAQANEAELAALTSANLGIEHTVCALSGQDILEWMDEGLAAMDQPSHDGQNIFIVSKASRQAGIIAALCGAGADELHGGYGHFDGLARLAWIGRIPLAIAFLKGLLPLAARRRGGKVMAERVTLLLRAVPDMATMVREKRRFFTPSQIQRLWPEAPPAAAPAAPGSPGRFSSVAPLTAVSLAEIEGYLKNTLLRDADWATMANHQELRVPYLGRRYMELVLSLPWSAKERIGATNKPLLAKTISPANQHVVTRAKTGFELDYGIMLRGPLQSRFAERADFLNSRFGFRLDAGFLTQGLDQPGSDKLARRIFALYALGDYLARHLA